MQINEEELVDDIKRFVSENVSLSKISDEELKELKFLLRSRQQSFDRNIRNKDFYKKVLENIT